MDFVPLIEQKRKRFEELEAQILSATLFENPKKAKDIMREHSRLKSLFEDWETYERAKGEFEENRELVFGSDAEMAELAASEIPVLERRIAELAKSVQYFLLPPEPHEHRDAIIEIRAGTGGSEAALFAADLFRMYSKFAEMREFKIEELDHSSSELGGVKEVIFKVSGSSVFRVLRYESGVHRVQRVPLTEAQGRIHTSTATVAVLPEAEEVDIEIKPEDLRIEVSRAGGLEVRELIQPIPPFRCYISRLGRSSGVRTVGANRKTKRKLSQFSAPASWKKSSSKKPKNILHIGAA